jgi:hypothetical protein
MDETSSQYDRNCTDYIEHETELAVVADELCDVPRENSLDRRHEYQNAMTAASRVNCDLN